MPTEIDLSEKVAVVSGGAAGIGKASVLALSEAGATVAAIDIDEAGAAKTVAEAGSGVAIGCDLRDPGSIETMRDRVLSDFGGIDILVNCAGLIYYHKGVKAVTTDEWDQVMEINLRGTFLVCQAFVESLKKRRDGRIVNFSSLAARVGGIEAGVHYTAAKAGLIGLTRALAKECGPFGTTVNALAPGIILTEPVKEQVSDNEATYREQIPLGRLGVAEDVADTVLFLASPLSSYITGVVLDVNGGLYMG